jgi:hypothetical protein
MRRIRKSRDSTILLAPEFDAARSHPGAREPVLMALVLYRRSVVGFVWQAAAFRRTRR